MADRLPVVLRQRAREDVEEAIDWYRDNADSDAALRFVDAFAEAMDHLALHPLTGSTRYAIELQLPGLRSWRLRGFPYLAFYVHRADHIDVWRLLHAHRDIPSWLIHSDDEPEGDLF